MGNSGGACEAIQMSLNIIEASLDGRSAPGCMVRSGGTVAQVKATVKAGAEHHQGIHHPGGGEGRLSASQEAAESPSWAWPGEPPLQADQACDVQQRLRLSRRCGRLRDEFILYNAKSPADGPGANPAAGLIDQSIAACAANEEAATSYLSNGLMPSVFLC
jgi:hypothetical protein